MSITNAPIDKELADLKDKCKWLQDKLYDLEGKVSAIEFPSLYKIGDLLEPLSIKQKSDFGNLVVIGKNQEDHYNWSYILTSSNPNRRHHLTENNINEYYKRLNLNTLGTGSGHS